jgi:threonine/homoserine/homoserine lactone efflux protein
MQLLSRDRPLRGARTGAAFILLYFGLRMLFSLPRSSLNTETKDKKSANLTAMGITLSLANPYWGIWWLSIGLGLVLAAQQKGFLWESAPVYWWGLACALQSPP